MSFLSRGPENDLAYQILRLYGVLAPWIFLPFRIAQSFSFRAWCGLAVLPGIPLGLGLFTFIYAEGFSYISADPKVCVQCHIMRDQYDAWQKGSHHSVAVCVTCHLPHPFVFKMLAKADNGFRHSKAFTLQNFHEPIQITPRDSRILEKNCISCHEGVLDQILRTPIQCQSQRSCVHCHRNVGHGARG